MRRDNSYFIRYEKQVMELLTPIMQQGQLLTREMLKNATDFVKGQHSEELVASLNSAYCRHSGCDGLVR